MPITVKPAAGRQVPIPEQGFRLLREAGEAVTHNAYWQRRLNDGDVLKVTTAKGSAKA